MAGELAGLLAGTAADRAAARGSTLVERLGEPNLFTPQPVARETNAASLTDTSGQQGAPKNQNPDQVALTNLRDLAKTNPLAAFGLALEAFGAGIEGRESLFSRLKDKQFKQRQAERAAQKDKAQMVKTIAETVKNVPPENRAAVAKSLSESIRPNDPQFAETVIGVVTLPDAASKSANIAMAVEKIGEMGDFLANILGEQQVIDGLPKDEAGNVDITFPMIEQLNARLPEDSPMKLSGPELRDLQERPDVMQQLGLQAPSLVETELTAEAQARGQRKGAPLKPDKSLKRIQAEAEARARGTKAVTGTGKTLDQIEAEAAARARGTASEKTPVTKQAQRADGTVIFATEEEIQRFGLTPVQRVDEISVPTETGPVTIRRGAASALESTRVPEVAKPLGRDAQEALVGGFNTLDFLQDLEENIGETGLIEGNFNRIAAFLGLNPDAIDFQTARNQLRLSAQSIIKGIPSNFDVQTLVATIPEIGLPENVNQSRIDASRKIARRMIEDTIAYHKFTGVRIPPEILGSAAERGIDVDGISPYSGSGDPLARTSDLAWSTIDNEALQNINPQTFRDNPSQLRRYREELIKLKEGKRGNSR